MGTETTTTEPSETAEHRSPEGADLSTAGQAVLEAPAPSEITSFAPDVPRLGKPFGSSGTIPGAEGSGSPSYVFLAIVSIISLLADVSTKLWAEHTLEGYPGIIQVWENHIAFILAKNRGGAWGLLQSTNENVRRPFFLLVSAAAIAFIVTLYRRLQPRQRALKWGLPLVLGGALGNVFDRIRYGHVIDFIDVHVVYKGTDHHWPTFNVADIAICVGVALMAIDMFSARRPRRPHVAPFYVPEPAPPEGPAADPVLGEQAFGEQPPPEHPEHAPEQHPSPEHAEESAAPTKPAD